MTSLGNRIKHVVVLVEHRLGLIYLLANLLDAVGWLKVSIYNNRMNETYCTSKFRQKYFFNRYI
jgi:hypothetical protein